MSGESSGFTPGQRTTSTRATYLKAQRGEWVKPMTRKILIAAITSIAVVLVASLAISTATGPQSTPKVPDKSAADESTHSPDSPEPQPALLPAAKRGVYVVSHSGSGYKATPKRGGGSTYRGSLKSVLQRTASRLQSNGGGKIKFTKGTFDFGSDYYLGVGVRGITFAGSGMNRTMIKNSSSAEADTEPFNFNGAYRVRIKNLAVSAGGPDRTTSDALDFDKGSRVVVVKVKVVNSRSRGIVFDGKDAGAQATRNRVRNCVIRGVPSHGIELLAASKTTVTGCTITNTGRDGIALTKASPTAPQANKKSTGNLIENNRIDQSGEHGILVLSGDNNRIVDNYVTNSSDEVASRDGIRVDSTDGISCDDNVVSGNRATDNQKPKTQKYGLNIADPRCHRTVVKGNDFAGNLTAPMQDLGTGTK